MENTTIRKDGQPAPQRIMFTLIELLVVVAIIAILMAILLPALQSAKGKAQEIKCIGNIKNIFLAETGYINDANDYISPVAPGRDANGDNDYYWTNLLSSYVGYAAGGTRNSFRDNLKPETLPFFCPTQDFRKNTLATVYTNPNCYPSYGLNGYIAGGGIAPGVDIAHSAKLTAIRKPSAVMIFGDVQFAPTQPERGFRTMTSYYFSDRHSMGFNCAWLDGHLSKMKQVWAQANVSAGDDVLGYLQLSTKYYY